jgi:hypothetical protein
MKQTTLRRLEQIEEASGVSPQIFFIWDECQGGDAIERDIASMKASGQAKEGDQFHTVGWLRADEPLAAGRK